VRKDFPAAAKVIVGLALRSGTFSDSLALINLYGDGGVTLHGNLLVRANGAVALYRAGVQVAISAAGVCSPNSWHYIELSATVSDTVGVLTARVDGVQVATFTGDTKQSGTAATLDRVELNFLANGANGFIDDLYICDGLGAAPWNDFLGDVRVMAVKPNGAGSQTDLTPVGSASNYANVDEFPFSAGDYNHSATAGHRDLYAMEDVTAGITVLGVQVTSTAHKTDTTVRSVKNLVKSGATVTASAAKVLSTSPSQLSTAFQVNPTTSAQWTAAEVNAMETGVEVLGWRSASSRSPKAPPAVPGSTRPSPSRPPRRRATSSS